MKAPTDIKILNTIYNTYYNTFKNFRDAEGNPVRYAKNYVPIDTQKIGEKIGVDGDIVFGRLYYHLQEKYGFEKEGGITGVAKVPFFTLKAGEDEKCIHFPLMASVLAKLRDERKRYFTSVIFSGIALLASIAAVLVAALT